MKQKTNFFPDAVLWGTTATTATVFRVIKLNDSNVYVCARVYLVGCLEIMITFVWLWKKIRVEEKRGEIKRINCEKGKRTRGCTYKGRRKRKKGRGKGGEKSMEQGRWESWKMRGRWESFLGFVGGKWVAGIRTSKEKKSLDRIRSFIYLFISFFVFLFFLLLSFPSVLLFLSLLSLSLICLTTRWTARFCPSEWRNTISQRRSGSGPLPGEFFRARRN